MDYMPDTPKMQEELPPQIPLESKRSERMALASLVLGMITLLTSCFIYISVVCGSLGIILALLSRGGSMRLSRQGKAGLTLSSIGLVLSILIFVGLISFIFYYYGGIDGVLQEYMNIYGVDTIEELYTMFGIPVEPVSI